MKEQKFRYIFKNKKFGDLSFYYLSLKEIEKGALTKILQSGMTENGYELISRDSYIGLKDKNNNEIYEGDILKGNYIVKFGYQKEVFNGFICLGDGEEDNDYVTVCGIYLESPYSDPETLSNYLDTYNELKIIGNICKNPDLLKGDK